MGGRLTGEGAAPMLFDCSSGVVFRSASNFKEAM